VYLTPPLMPPFTNPAQFEERISNNFRIIHRLTP
jgi:hypothetical protein